MEVYQDKQSISENLPPYKLSNSKYTFKKKILVYDEIDSYITFLKLSSYERLSY